MRLFRRKRAGDDASRRLASAASKSEHAGSWDDTVAESAVLAHVVNERPEGVTTSEIARALGLDLERAERAVAALTAADVLGTDHRGKIVPAVFGASE